MARDNIFAYVKRNIALSDFVATLPNVSGLHSVGGGKYRCNNVIEGGSNTTAMVIDNDLGFFKMFSHNQESGDIIELYRHTLGGMDMSPKQAALSLAQHMGVSIPDELLLSNAFSETSELKQASDALCELFHDFLVNSNHKDAVSAREYLKERSLPLALIEKWKLGVIPSSDKQARAMCEKAGSDYVLRKIGMYGGKGGDFITMRGRLVFPIFDISGNCISFSSRTIPGVSTPLPDSKYINTSSTDIYEKKRTLFGQHLIKQAKADTVIVCEGNFDVIALNEYCAGTSTIAVATCGTALTKGHIELLKNNGINTVICAFDSDDAGMDAAASSLWIANHVTALFLAIPEGKDPWDAYTSGADIDVSPKQSLIAAAAKYKAETLNAHDVVSWVQKAADMLMFGQDKALLIDEVARRAGISKKFLNHNVDTAGARTTQRSQHNNGEQWQFSQEASTVLSALLSLPMEQRRWLCYTALDDGTVDDVYDLCGAVTQEESDAFDYVFGFEVEHMPASTQKHLASLTPGDEEEDTARRCAAQAMAIVLSSQWEQEPPRSDIGWEYLPVVSSIASGQCAQDGIWQLATMFECAVMK